jgi:hypothetical protein
MGAFEHVLKRWGFVRLGRYGLVLTPEERVMTQRPILDDGLGGKIVGWRDRDLAAMELEHWAPAGARPAAPPAPPKPAAVVALPPPAPVKVAIAPAPAPALVVIAAPVAEAAETEDDEWEWEIALARARAEAEPIPAPTPAPAPLMMRPLPAPVVEAEPEPDWEQVIARARARVATEPLLPVVVPQPAPAPVRRVQATPQPFPVAPVTVRFASATPPPIAPARTVIPVPALPRAADPSLVRPMEPRRTPRSTSRVDDTIRTHAAPPANDDRTSPGMILPKIGGLPGTKRVAAKQK